MFLTPGSANKTESPFAAFQSCWVNEYQPQQYDWAFLGGMDWQAYLPLRRQGQPVINLIQHVRHADPANPLFTFLSEPAIRICVSPEVETAISATGQVNGPVFTINNGLSLPDIHHPKSNELLILGVKNPLMANQLFNLWRRKGRSVRLITDLLPREQLLAQMSQSRLVVLLPHEAEGFYLPALEAMFYADLTIVPDVQGNRSFCHHLNNCLMPKHYHWEAINQQIEQAFELLPSTKQLEPIKSAAKTTALSFSLEKERRAFHQLLDQTDSIWQQYFR